jgi:hypothetical protein
MTIVCDKQFTPQAAEAATDVGADDYDNAAPEGAFIAVMTVVLTALIAIAAIAAIAA